MHPPRFPPRPLRGSIPIQRPVLLCATAALITVGGGCTVDTRLPTTATASSQITEFCLEGTWDLGVRNQGLSPGTAEPTPNRRCVITAPADPAAPFQPLSYSARGNASTNFDDSWAVDFLPPDLVRVAGAARDVEHRTEHAAAEAVRIRRLDPLRLAEEIAVSGVPTGLEVELDADGRPLTVTSRVSMALRGEVPVVWIWDWADPGQPNARLTVGGDLLLQATGSWRVLDAVERSALWPAAVDNPIEAPAGWWPTRIRIQRVDLADGVSLVRGAGRGFQQLVVDTEEGLVVADAVAAGVQFHQIPAADREATIGIEGVDGLSQGLLDFLAEEFPGRPLRAVALTHHHDDHAGGAAPFEAAGAALYAPLESANGIAAGLSAAAGREIAVRGVGSGGLDLGRAPRRVRLVELGPNPHSAAALGIWAVDAGRFFVSDVHIPRSEQPSPSPGSALTECWFAGWAVDHLPEEVLVINSHSAIATPVSRLRSYLDSEPCRSIATDA